MNGAYPSASKDADGNDWGNGITGCGPASAGSTDYYPHNGNVPAGTPLDENTIESPTACSTNTDYAYNGSVGVLASTTNNTYGIYDVSGGAREYAIGNRTNSNTLTESDSYYFHAPTSTPYVDLYRSSDGFGTKPEWSNSDSTGEELFNYDVCTFETCGGSSTYETNTSQSANTDGLSWGSTSSFFTTSGSSWFYRGGGSDVNYANPFFNFSINGGINRITVRIILMAN